MFEKIRAEKIEKITGGKCELIKAGKIEKIIPGRTREIKTRDEFEEEAAECAYHEAGHAVIAYILGATVRKISILIPMEEPDSYFGGLTLSDAGEVLRPGQYIMVTVAGRIAEEKYSGRSHPGDDKDDRESVRRRTRYFGAERRRKGQPRALTVNWGRDTERRYIQFLKLLTRDVLNMPWVWSAVQALATALLDKKELGSTATKIIAAHTKKDPMIGM
jgi:hypothetical protein